MGYILSCIYAGGGISFGGGIKGMGGKWRHCIVAGVLAGLSIMSKGPVSVYALLLPFVIAFAFVMRPCIKGCRVAIGVMCVIALVVGG